jgi:hypothetical protein
LFLCKFEKELSTLLTVATADPIERLDCIVVPLPSEIASNGKYNFFLLGVITMKQFNKTILAASIVLALGSATSAWANPTNNANDPDHNNDVTQTATATSTQGGNTSPQANEYSTAEQNDSSDNSDNSDHSSASGTDAAANNNSTATSDRSDHSDRSDNSDHSDNSYADADDWGVAANGGGNATNSSTASATDAAANNGSTATSDRSDHSYADVHGTGAAANGGGNATYNYTDDHSYANAEANGDRSFAAAANGGGNAEVHVAVSESKLDGYVSHNESTFSGGVPAHYETSNSIAGGISGAGVFNINQNTGINVLNQQSVSTQASLVVN